MKLADYNDWCKSHGLRSKMHKAEHWEPACLGFLGELGEVTEHIKKAKYHAKPLDVEAFRLELGDLLFYAVWLDDMWNKVFDYRDTFVSSEFTDLKIIANLITTASEAMWEKVFYYGSYTWIKVLAERFANCTIEEIADLNKQKLTKRYPDGFPWVDNR